MDRPMDDERHYYALVKTAFAKLAPFYDLICFPITWVRDPVVDFAGMRNASTVLDVATGTGSQALAFAKKGYEVTGIDLSEEMLQIARTKNRYRNAYFELGDATRLPIWVDEFDLVCISFALHDMPLAIRERVLKEMVRVAKPDGTIVIVDYALPQNPIGRFLIYHLVKLYEGEYYLGFIHSDFRALVAKTGIVITDERSLLLGAARLWKGVKKEPLT